ncbi:hypothetical protein XPA_008328 [Xanthoria parietina]
MQHVEYTPLVDRAGNHVDRPFETPHYLRYLLTGRTSTEEPQPHKHNQFMTLFHPGDSALTAREFPHPGPSSNSCSKRCGSPARIVIGVLCRESPPPCHLLRPSRQE